jgi:hypothetical protein
MLTQMLALTAGALIAGWLSGGLLLRLGGLLGVLAGLLTATTNPVGLALAARGGLAWLAGHWLHALRHHTYKSPLARRIYLQVLPPRMDATRRWTISDHGEAR